MSLSVLSNNCSPSSSSGGSPCTISSSNKRSSSSSFSFSSSSSSSSSSIIAKFMLILLATCVRFVLYKSTNLSDYLLSTIPSALSSPLYSIHSLQEGLVLRNLGFSFSSSIFYRLPPLVIYAWEALGGFRSCHFHFGLLLVIELLIGITLADTAILMDYRLSTWLTIFAFYALHPLSIASMLTHSVHSIRLLILSTLLFFSSLTYFSSSSTSSQSRYRSVCAALYGLLLYLDVIYLPLGCGLAMMLQHRTHPLPTMDTNQSKDHHEDHHQDECYGPNCTTKPGSQSNQSHQNTLVTKKGQLLEETTTTTTNLPPFSSSLNEFPWGTWLTTAAKLYGFAGVFLATLHFASYIVNGNSWSYLRTSLRDVLDLLDLSPNLGCYWYIFQLVFPRYRQLFLFIFHLHTWMYVLPLCLVIHYRPVALTHALVAITLLFQPYPTVSDFCFLVCLLLSHGETVKKMEFLKVVLVSTLGIVVFFTQECMSLIRNTGNPNFMLMMQVVYVVSTGILIIDFLRWTVRGIQKSENKDNGNSHI